MGLLEQVIGNVIGGALGGGRGRGGSLGGGRGGALGGGGGTSPIMMALMALLASRGGGGGLGGMLGGGGLGGMLGGQGSGGVGGMLGGILGNGDARPDESRRDNDLAGAFDNPAGPSAGEAMTGGGFGGGLGGLLERFTQSGHGEKMNSWIGPGQNEPIEPQELESALGEGTISDLSRQTGMPKGDLLSQLSQVLPGVVDQLTPKGRMPQREEMERW